MTERSRRTFLKTASVAVASAGAALTPGLTAQASAAPAPAGPLPDQPLIAYVKDHKTGEIAVTVGEHEVTYRDRDLTARLARIATHAKHN